MRVLQSLESEVARLSALYKAAEEEKAKAMKQAAEARTRALAATANADDALQQAEGLGAANSEATQRATVAEQQLAEAREQVRCPPK